ncbi:MAG: hypothetical protein WB587_09690 [Nitrososphaeraceae archaeon]|jgi:hypothetical protein
MAKKEAADKNSNILDIKIDIIRGLDSVTDANITYATIKQNRSNYDGHERKDRFEKILDRKCCIRSCIACSLFSSTR